MRVTIASLSKSNVLGANKLRTAILKKKYKRTAGGASDPGLYKPPSPTRTASDARSAIRYAKARKKRQQLVGGSK